jgi:hypothetical protein
MSTAEPTHSRAPNSPAPLRTTGALRINWKVNVALGLFIVACGSDEGSGGTPGTGGVAAVPTGGMVGSGGVVGSGGTTPTGGSKSVPTGGTVASGGSGGASTGGTVSTGGTTGGTTGKAGGASTGGSGGGGGGAAATGGTGPKGGSGGSATGGSSGGAKAGGGSGGAGTGTCQKGTTKGAEVLFIGESFVQASTIPEETTKLARAAGSLTANESYVDKSVSGTWIGDGSGNSIPNQYKNNSSGVRFVIMNGGGNDCWQGGQETHRTAALNAAKALFQNMQTNGVEKVVYHFYPDPIGSQYASLTACLNLLRPDMKAVCDAQTSPKCYWLDLRETWKDHPEYTRDGIHVDGPGNVPTATAIWKTMEANCVAP